MRLMVTQLKDKKARHEYYLYRETSQMTFLPYWLLIFSLAFNWKAGISFIIKKLSHPFLIAELSSGPKGRRAEPHNYRAKIEIEKTMRLSFHGHRG